MRLEEGITREHGGARFHCGIEIRNKYCAGGTKTIPRLVLEDTTG